MRSSQWNRPFRVRNAEARGSNPRCSTNKPATFKYLQPQVYRPLFSPCDVVVTSPREICIEPESTQAENAKKVVVVQPILRCCCEKIRRLMPAAKEFGEGMVFRWKGQQL